MTERRMPDRAPARRTVGRRSGRALLLYGLALAAPMTAPAAAQDGLSLSVEISGVEGGVADNVRAMLAIARAADTGRVARARVERLHDQAEADIRRALEPFGYYRPAIARSLRRDGTDWTARYEIDPGPVVRVRQLAVRLTGAGADQPAFRAAVDSFPLRSGDPLRHAVYETGKLGFLRVASDSGYLRAAFDTSVVVVDRDQATADVHLVFDTGPRFRFGPVRFEQQVLDDEFVRTRLPFERGDPWQQHLLLALQTNLAEDRYFQRVEVIPQLEEAIGLEVPIRVVLESREPVAYELGVGYGSDTGPRGRVDVLFRRVNRGGHHADASLILATREQRITANYMIPAVGHPLGELTVQGGFARLDPGPSTSRAIAAKVQLARPRWGWRESLSLSFLRESFRVGPDTGVASLLVAAGNWERTRSNNWLYPSRGIRARVGIQGSGTDLLGTVALLRLDAGVKGVYTLATGVRMLGRLDAGRLFTSEFRRLPPTLRYFAGGDQSVRGFDYFELSPRDALGRVLGGRVLLAASAEVDVRVHRRWLVAGFADAGNAFLDLDLDELESGVGGGIRFLAPIGMIRLDIAFPVSRPGRGPQLHFSIGPDL